MDQERFESTIKNAIVARNAATKADRDKIYDAARNSVRRRDANNEEMLAALEAAIASIEATFERPAPSRTAKSYGPVLLAAGLLALGGVAGAAATRYFGSTDIGAGQLNKLETLAHAYDDHVGQVPVAVDFIREVIDEIVRRQASDRGSLETISKNMTPLSRLDPELNERLPASLPAGTAVTVRANAYDVKVLMNWPLCGIVSVSNPELLDPVRSANPTIGCPAFGLWTPGAKRW